MNPHFQYNNYSTSPYDQGGGTSPYSGNYMGNQLMPPARHPMMMPPPPMISTSSSPYDQANQPQYQGDPYYANQPYSASNLSPYNQMQFNPNDPNSGASWGMDPNRRYSSPQMGYYDLITGEYRYRNADNNFNQSPLLSNYAGETEPPMCENSCRCCQYKLPFNCLTISLITSLMLLMMFSLFKAILGTKPNNPNNMALFQNMIWLMALVTLIFVILILLKYIFNRDSWPFNTVFCKWCRLLSVMLGNPSNPPTSSKHRFSSGDIYANGASQQQPQNHHPQQQQQPQMQPNRYFANEEEFV